MKTQDLEETGVIIDIRNYQIFSNLRTELRGCLKAKNGIDFIENNDQGCYRVSTHPNFIEVDKKRLLANKDGQIRRLARLL